MSRAEAGTASPSPTESRSRAVRMVSKFAKTVPVKEDGTRLILLTSPAFLIFAFIGKQTRNNSTEQQYVLQVISGMDAVDAGPLVDGEMGAQQHLPPTLCCIFFPRLLFPNASPSTLAPPGPIRPRHHPRPKNLEVG